MPDRLDPLDASFLYLEEPTLAMHVGSVVVLDPAGGTGRGLDHDALLALVADRIGDNSRYRQRVREVPGRLAAPVWVDDVDFDLTYHVRRSALPAPGTQEQLAEFVARIQSRPLDREHPLWEIYLVEGLEGGRLALVTKTHQALVDGITAVDIAHLLLDREPTTQLPEAPAWAPRREPGDLELVAEAVAGFVRRPLSLVERVKGGVLDGVGGAARRSLGEAGAVLGHVVWSAASPAPATALGAKVRAPRRFHMVRTDLDAYRDVRDAMAQGDRPVDVTITDVALTVVTGALRIWLQARGEPVHSASTVRAMVPISVSEALADSAERASNDVVACFVDLPVGEPNGRLRLERIAYQTRHQVTGARAVSADALTGMAGFAPATLHHLGARLAGAMSRRMFNLVVTNVPGPQRVLYVGDARVEATYPVVPVTRGHALAVGLTSYDGGVYLGLNGDRTAMSDLDILADGVVESLEEIRTTVGAKEIGR